MRALNVLPNGLEEIVRIYGDPDRDGNGRADPEWWEENMVLCDLPFPLRASWNPRSGDPPAVDAPIRGGIRCSTR